MDTSTQKQGAAAVIFPGDTTNLYRDDSDLTSDFPFKSGTTNTTLSATCWVKFDTLVAQDAVFAKWRVGSEGSFRLYALEDTGVFNFTLAVRNEGGTADFLSNTQVNIATGIWYHVGVTYTATDGSWKVRVWDDNASSVTEDSGTTAIESQLSDSALAVGARTKTGGQSMDGTVDELVLFKDILSSDEIDEIRAGTYGNDQFIHTPYTATKKAVLIKSSGTGAGTVFYEDI
jgi:hypothetical protein